MSEVASTHSDKLLDQVSKMLIEEKWTRTTIEQYSKQNFSALDEYIEKAKDENICEELKKLCTEHLNNSPKSVTALYIASVLMYEHDVIDDSHIFDLIFLFKEHQKWKIVEFLCKKVLTYRESKSALRLLGEVYSETNNKQELLIIWERLAKVDYENGDAPRKLAQHYEKSNQIESSIAFYKTALKRFAKSHYNIKVIEEIWGKLLEWIPEQLEFFFSIHGEIEKYQAEKAEHLLLSLLPHYKKEQEHKQTIVLLQRLIQYDSKHKTLRNELMEIFSKLYEHHSQLQNYIEKSNLMSSNNLQQALKDFEKYIVFDEGSFVYHRSWGVGKIIECQENGLLINFEEKDNHSMSFKIALTSLKVLPKDHIWIEKRKSLEELRQLAKHKEGIATLLEKILKSYDNQATMKDIKSEMLEIIPENEWAKWWTKAKQVIKTSAILGNSHNKRDLYFLRDKPLSVQEEAFSVFNSSHSFDKKLAIFLDYLKHNGDFEDEGFQQMLAFFVDIVNSRSVIDSKTIKSYLILKKVKREHPDIAFELTLNSFELLSAKDDLMNVYNDMQDSEYKKDILLRVIKKNDSQWPELFLEFLLNARVSKVHNLIVEQLYEHNQELLRQGFSHIINSYRTNPETYFWFLKLVLHDKAILHLTGNTDSKRLVFNLFYCLDILNKELSNKKSTIVYKAHRKLLPQIVDFLLKDDFFADYLRTLNKSDARKILAIINSLSMLNEKTCAQFITILGEQFSELVYEEKAIPEHHQFLVTKASYERKQRELQHILEVEIPENSKAIGVAMELGDLRENADYIAALEHQKQLQQHASTITNELSRIKILKSEEIDASVISPGTEVTLHNMDTNTTEHYIILGEWESNMEEGIISYKSPFGQTLLGHKANDTVHFHHEHIQKKYQVQTIKKFL